MMNMRRGFLSVVAAAVLALGAGSVVTAQQTGDIPITIEVGQAPDAGLSWQVVQSSAFPSVPSSFEAQTTTGALTATVSDTRGTEAGWVLTVSGTAFTGAETERTIPVSNLTIAPGPVQVVVGQRDPLPTANTITMSTEPQVLMEAPSGSGAGRYSVVLTGTLVIPGNTLVDTYSTVLTVDLAAAPQG